MTRGQDVGEPRKDHQDRSPSQPKPVTPTITATEGKRTCKHSESSDTENQYHKKRYSLPANGSKEMTFQLDDVVESPLSDYNDNVQNARTRSSLDGSSPNLPLSTLASDKRKSLRQQAIQNDKKIT